MIIYLGADHAGFSQKENIKKWLTENNYQVADRGTNEFNNTDDYNDFAISVVKELKENPHNLGILFCHSGAGMAIATNRFKGIRAVVGFSKEIAKEAKTHNNANILVIPSGFVNDEDAKEYIDAWLKAEFLNEGKYIRRNEKLDLL